MESLKNQLKKREAKFVHLALPDLNGIFRERRLRSADVPVASSPFGSFCNVLHHWDVADTVYGAGPFVGELIEPDLSSVRGYPFEQDAAWLVADYCGPSRATSPRNLLRGQIERAKKLGFDARAAFEFEFMVYEETASSIRSKRFDSLTAWAPDNRCWDALSAGINAGVIAELQATLDLADLPALGLGMELGAGCVEGTLEGRNALQAADDAAFFKLVTKIFFRRKGLSACFMSQPDISAPGLSGHIHLSLLDEGGKNLFRAERGPSELEEHFVAGVLTLLPELIAMPLHTVNAFRRLSPGNWAPRTPTWSVENYSTAIRLVVGDHDEARLEFRIPGADVNPYLGLAMLLGAGLWGIEHRRPVPQVVTGDGRTDPPDGTGALPHDLLEAATALGSSTIARELFGAPFVDLFVASRIHEFNELRKAVSAAEKARYFEAV